MSDANEINEPVTVPPTDTPEWATPLSVGHPILDQLLRSNSIRFNLINQQDRTFDINRVFLMTLVDDLFPDFKERQAFELIFQQKLAEVLASVEQQIETDKLTEGTPAASGLIVPGREPVAA